MRIDDNAGDPLSRAIQQSQATAACFPVASMLRPSATDDHILASAVIADIVGIVRELHGGENLKRGPIENLRRSVKSARHKRRFRGSVEEHSLWFSQAGDRVIFCLG